MPSTLEILQDLKNLSTLVLNENFLGESMPTAGIDGFMSIKNLALSNCQLFGSIPDWLKKFTRLNALDLSGNMLSGKIPGWLGNFSRYLKYLDLSNNSLSGEIPKSLTNLRMECQPLNNMNTNFASEFPRFPPALNLSYNKFTGQILPEIWHLHELAILDLSWNQLSGSISWWAFVPHAQFACS